MPVFGLVSSAQAIGKKSKAPLIISEIAQAAQVGGGIAHALDGFFAGFLPT